MPHRDDPAAPQAHPTNDPAAHGCDSTFDRWRCGLPAGHGGDHAAESPGSQAHWSDGATGMGLRDL